MEVADVSSLTKLGVSACSLYDASELPDDETREEYYAEFCGYVSASLCYDPVDVDDDEVWCDYNMVRPHGSKCVRAYDYAVWNMAQLYDVLDDAAGFGAVDPDAIVPLAVDTKEEGLYITYAEGIVLELRKANSYDIGLAKGDIASFWEVLVPKPYKTLEAYRTSDKSLFIRKCYPTGIADGTYGYGFVPPSAESLWKKAKGRAAAARERAERNWAQGPGMRHRL